MADFTRLVESVKIAALGAVEASKPVNVIFGTVTKAEPLEINIEQRLTLTSEQLILTRNVTDYTFEMSMEHWTESTDSHSHQYTGRKTFKAHNALTVGEKVILIRMQGGQKFIVIDRLEG